MHPIAVFGPTASGKSALGLALAHELDGEVVNVDSMQLYRGMDIGTAKLTPAEREAAGWTGREGAGGVTVDVAAFMTRRGQAVERWHGILQATANRPARFGCFGLHEWAMVHGLEADDRRHGGVPLRLGREATDAVTETHTIACSHFDAYRFFTGGPIAPADAALAPVTPQYPPQ